MGQRRRTGTLRRFLLIAAGVCLLSTTLSCSEKDRSSNAQPAAKREDAFRVQRERMVRYDIAGRFTGATRVDNERVLEAMRKTPRHRFVPEEFAGRAYADHPLPIGYGQTISQPYVVALMTQLAEVGEGAVVLEIGTGSGYQAAVLAELAKEVYTIEIVPELGQSADERLKELGYENVHVKVGDGYLGWPEHAPFDAILVTAAPDEIPTPLKEQLKPGGRMVIPVGPVQATQELMVVHKDKEGVLTKRSVLPVRFVPFLRKEEEE